MKGKRLHEHLRNFDLFPTNNVKFCKEIDPPPLVPMAVTITDTITSKNFDLHEERSVFWEVTVSVINNNNNNNNNNIY